MSSAFTEQEKQEIRAQLRLAARRCASTMGMRRCTVDQLAAEAGISKGAFYKFYDTKEHLFLELLEDWHAEIYGRAARVLHDRLDLPPGRRMAEAILEACSVMEQNGMVDFFELDLPHLLRKMPPELLAAHYHSDDVHIAELMERSGIAMAAPPALAQALVRALMLTLSHREHIGPEYLGVLRLLAESAFDRLTQTGEK